MDKQYKYDAFISYRHTEADKAVASKLQKMLEDYKLPKSVSRDVSQWRIFRDETELPTSSNLSGDIKAALEDSRYLIVICSKTTKESRWCMEEITYFKELHKGNNSNIITLVVEGEPAEVFPAELCNELIEVCDEDGNVSYQNHVIEPLAASIVAPTLKQSLKKLKSEFLRIAAPLAGCGYDTLYNRNQKKKNRRFLGIAAFVVAFLFAFGVYTSAMLLEINAQKSALQTANENLRIKTDALDQSNKDLQKSNDELAMKTKEAEDNLAEAEKQRSEAEKNLAEANRQKQIAEENLAEANRQKQIAEENLAEANRQQKIATQNAKEAENQKNIAEANMKTAQENEAKANQANYDLRIKNSDILANQAEIYLENGDRISAINAAIEALPANEEDNLPVNIIAERVLTEATNVYGQDLLMKKTLNLAGYVKQLEYSPDGSRIIAKDSTGALYLIDANTKQVIKAYSDVGGKDISVFCVDGSNMYISGYNNVVSVNLVDGSENWLYTYEPSQNEYSSVNYITTNNNTDMFIMYTKSLYAGYLRYVVVNKNGEFVAQNRIENVNGNVNIAYTDNKGNFYFEIGETLGDVSVLYQISLTDNGKALNEKRLNFDEKIVAIGESHGSLVINMKDSEGEEGYSGKISCLDAETFKEKWCTSYSTSSYFDEYSYNKVLEYGITDKGLENCTLIVADKNYILISNETGNIRVITAEDEAPIYCSRSIGNGFVNVGLADGLWEGAFVYEVSSKPSTKGLSIWGVCQFDREYKYMAFCDGDNVAVAQENSSSVDIYYYYQNSDNYIILEEMPDIYSLNSVTDNSNFVVATYGEMTDGVYIYYVVVYNIKTNKLVANIPFEKSVSFAGLTDSNKLVAVDGNGVFNIYDIQNGVLENSVNLKEEIQKYRKNYVSIVSLKGFINGNKVIVACGDAIVEVDISGKEPVVDVMVYEYYSMDDFVSSKDYNYIAWTCREENSSEHKMMYLCKETGEVGFVKNNDADISFEYNEIESLDISDDGRIITFVHTDGYVGIYSIGDDSTAVIDFPQENVKPLLTKTVPDGASVLILFANGELRSYSLETNENIGVYHIDRELSYFGGNSIEFIDNNIFILTTSYEKYFMDFASMEPRLKVPSSQDFLPHNEKFLSREYLSEWSKYKFILHDYYDTAELIEYAKDFVEKNK